MPPTNVRYIKWVDGERIFLLTYVDDLICFSKSDKLRKWWHQSLQARFKCGVITDYRQWILNIKLERSQGTDGNIWIEISQELAINKIAEAAGLINCKRKTTPIDTNVKICKSQDGDEP